MSTSETETETELKTRRSLAFANWIVNKLERRAEGAVEKASNHEMISKMTFILVLGMSYELLGEKVVTLVALLL